MPKVKSTKRIRKPKNKTVRNKSKEQNKSHIVRVFLEMLNLIKLYHWKTHSYAEHKATDELYAKLNEHIDTFVEVLLGKDGSRIKSIEKRMPLVDAKNIVDFKQRMYEYREFLLDLNNHFDKNRDSDLLNIRDEILADLNQFLYLITFNK
jgi:DNA-binding ferritin-like protein